LPPCALASDCDAAPIALILNLDFLRTEGEMADHGHNNAAGHPAMDYAEHEKTYDRFLVLAKWTTIGTVAILVFMAVTLL
jgi:hypothetical protein